MRLKIFAAFAGSFFCVFCYSQNPAQLSIAFTDNASAFPFSKLFGLAKEPIHPGVEFSFSRVTKNRKNHEWFYDVKAGYFYHRFVQHGIPVFIDYGYRYKPGKRFSAELALGAGYLHSIPATAVLQQDENGDYKNAKGIGRAQAMIALIGGLRYAFTIKKQTAHVFLQYQQRMQLPFIRSYVPLLPYNQLAAGLAVPISLFKNQSHK